MTPEAALDRVVHCLDRAHEGGFKAKAFVRARDVVRTAVPAEIAERAAAARSPRSMASATRAPG